MLEGRFALKLRMLLPLSLALAPLWGLAPVTNAMAQEELQQGPNSLVIHYRAARGDRAAFRTYLQKDFAAKLQAMKANGEPADFRIFHSWNRQPEAREGIAVLRFPSHSAVLRWDRLATHP